MENRPRRLARLAHALEQRKAATAARRAALDRAARQVEDERRALLDTVDASVSAHGLFVDLLAARMKRLDQDASRIAGETAALAGRMQEDARRAHLVERLRDDAVREAARDEAKRALADLLDAAQAAASSVPGDAARMTAASLRKA